jgi:hypothetical protein
VVPKKMTAYELQMGTIKASLDFYSYREAWRHLFAGRGLFNFLIRVKGRQLAKRILADNAEYVESLRRLDDWQNRLQRDYESWGEWARRLIDDGSIELEEKLERVQQYFNQKCEEVGASYASLESEFRPFCQNVADRLIERLGQQIENMLGRPVTGRVLASLPVFP